MRGQLLSERKASSSIRLVETIQIGVRNVTVFSRKSLVELYGILTPKLVPTLTRDGVAIER